MTLQILNADARKIPLADASVDCVVTSPPYWGLRDYGIKEAIGLEQSWDEYLAQMLQVFSEVWRVLKPTGTIWVNMGDSYAGSGRGVSESFNKGNAASQGIDPTAGRRDVGSRIGSQRGDDGHTSGVTTPGFKAKQLIGQPWRLAFALQAAGWYLRSDIIWHKPAPMPESCRDRPTKAHEYIFLLSKSERYFFDQAAWLEPCSGESAARLLRAHSGYNPPGQPPRGGLCAARPNAGAKPDKQRGHSRRHAGFNDRWDAMERDGQISGTRNRRTVWTVASQPTSEAHFATYPEALVEPCLLAGCPKHVCTACGVPWDHETEREASASGPEVASDEMPRDAARNEQGLKTAARFGHGPGFRKNEPTTKIPGGYVPQCTCNAPSQPGTVLDPFCGCGTTLVVANRQGKHGIGLELNPAYIEIAKRRLFSDVTPTTEEKKTGQKLLLGS